LHDFAVEELGYDPDSVTKKVKQKIYRCGRDVLARNNPGAQAKHRRRRLGAQGRPTSATFEFSLLEWWADYRDAVSSRLDTGAIVRAGLAIQKKVRDYCEKNEYETPWMPKMTKAWVREWCRRHHISLKKGTVRYKVSFDKVKRRTKRCWLNSCRVRYACTLLYGPTRQALGLPAQPYMHVSDQKPLHYNESESAGKGTLDWKGIPCKPLKSDVTGSRARLSPNTHMQNDPFSQPPIECTFKLKTGRCLKALCIPPGVNMSLQYSESGSYDAEKILAYLRRWTEEWTEERARNCDVRIFLERRGASPIN